MKNRIFNILLGAFVAVLAMALFGSCRKAPINGKLDGQWQIMSVEWLADGSDISPELRSYIDINLHVIQLRNVSLSETQGSLISGNLAYDKNNSTMTVDFPYNTEGGKLMQLQPWGIYSNPETFEIVKLDGKQLVLKSSQTMITCRRF